MAVRVPAAAGVKVMVLVQVAPAGRGLEQVEADLVKELAPEPVMVVEAVKLTAEEVLFLRVMSCVAADVPTVVDGKVRLEGVIVRPTLALVPVPLRLTVCGDPSAVSV